MSTDFDRVGDRYEELVEKSIGFCGREHDFYLEAKARRLLDLVTRWLGDPAHVRALDVGCGAGGMHRHLRALGRLEGADPSQAMIDAARRANPHVRYHVAPGERLPVADASYDLAVAVAVLHHVEPAQRVGLLRELARVTRPGGLSVVFEHNPLNPLTRVAVARCEFDEEAVLLRAAEVRRAFATLSLDHLETAYVLFFPWSGTVWQAIERKLGWLPLGAQYYVAAQRRAADAPR